MACNSTLKAVLYKIFPAEQFGQNGKWKQTFVLLAQDTNTSTQEVYDQKILFETYTDEIMGLLQSLQEGQPVNVKFDIQGKEYPDRNTGELKYFNKLKAYSLEADQQPQYAPVVQQAPQQAPQQFAQGNGQIPHPTSTPQGQAAYPPQSGVQQPTGQFQNPAPLPQQVPQQPQQAMPVPPQQQQGAWSVGNDQ